MRVAFLLKACAVGCKHHHDIDKQKNIASKRTVGGGPGLPMTMRNRSLDSEIWPQTKALQLFIGLGFIDLEAIACNTISCTYNLLLFSMAIITCTV